jgi:tetratricopeptide (TPR) repeat protein
MTIDDLKKIVLQFPDDPVSNFSLGNKLYEANKLDEAVGYIEKALSLNPNHILCYLILGNISAENDNFEKAKTYYENGLRQMKFAAPGSGQDLEPDFHSALSDLEF